MNDNVVTFARNTLRVAVDEYIEPWFVAKDLCDALEIADIEEAINSLDPEEVSTIDIIDDQGVPQKMAVISAEGIYEAFYMSRSPEAKAVERWITSQILPLFFNNPAAF